MMNRRPKTFGEGVARGAKGIGQGFYDGIAGVVSKPLAGVFHCVYRMFITFAVKCIILLPHSHLFLI